MSRIASRLEEEQRAQRERPLIKKKGHQYLYPDATYLKVNWGGSFTDSALLAAVGVNRDGYGEVSAVGVAGREKSAATLATEIVLRSSEEWALKCYTLRLTLRSSRKAKPTTFERLSYTSRLLHLWTPRVKVYIT